MTAKRSVGRPRQFDDDVERRLILDAAYVALRDHGHSFTIANILTTAGVSTRSFYRHFESKDALLAAMYMSDARLAADRLSKRLVDARSAPDAVGYWIDEIFSFTGSPRRAERVSVLGSITGLGADATQSVAAQGRALLTASLNRAIAAGAATGEFAIDDVGVATELVAAATLHAAGLAGPTPALDPSATTAFCLRALGAQ